MLVRRCVPGGASRARRAEDIPASLAEYFSVSYATESSSETANPALLAVAREATGLTQAELAAALSRLTKDRSTRISQGYVSRVESGALGLSGTRLDQFAAVLECAPDLLVAEAKVWALGDGCSYQRRRASTRASALRRLHARLNLLRLHLGRLAAATDRPWPSFNIVSTRVGGAVSPEDAVRTVRSALNVPTGPVASVIRLVEQAGALVLRLPLGLREVDAASLHPPGEAPLFVVNSDAPSDRQRFTLAHELGHATCIPADRFADPEDIADRFASELLMPSLDVAADLRAAPLTLVRLRQLKQTWRVSAAALTRRAHDLGVVTESG